MRWHQEEDYASTEIPCPSYTRGAFTKKFSELSTDPQYSDSVITAISSPPGEHVLPQDPGGVQLGGGAAAVLGVGRGPRLPTHLQHVHTQELATGDIQ